MFGNTICHIRASRSGHGILSAERAFSSSTLSRCRTFSGSGKVRCTGRLQAVLAGPKQVALRRPMPEQISLVRQSPATSFPSARIFGVAELR